MRRIRTKKNTETEQYITSIPEIFSYTYDDYKGCYEVDFYDYVPVETRKNIVEDVEEKFENN